MKVTRLPQRFFKKLPLRSTVLTGAGAAWLMGCGAAHAQDCQTMGLVAATAQVMQLTEAGYPPHTELIFQNALRDTWFVPLRSRKISSPPTAAAAVPILLSCVHQNVVYWQIAASAAGLTVDTDAGTLAYVNLSSPTQVIDSRRARAMGTDPTLDSLGVNYQLAASYVGSAASSRTIPSASGEFFAYNSGWHYSTLLGWSQGNKVSRYDSYALRESIETGTYLRLGDAISSPTAQGESLQFGGVSWGTERSLRPGDFSPVLPTLRNGSVLSGPLEVFINDNLQFQQTVQNGVIDLRNLPAQQGFNSYSVRTLDAQGNPVTLQREIYLPATLLPPGITAWRVDAGFKREDYFTRNAAYGAPLVVGSYSTGWSNDLTVGAQGLVTRKAASAGLEADQRLTELWTGHIGLQWARQTDTALSQNPLGSQQGSALQARLDGGGRLWRLVVEGTQAFQSLPSLGTRAALQRQRLLRAQWMGFAGWALSLAYVRSQRESQLPEVITSVSASTRVSDSGANVSLNFSRTQFQGVSQNNMSVSLFVPLTSPQGSTATALPRNESLFLSQNNVDSARLSRAQFTSSGYQPTDGVWTVGATRDAKQALSALDGNWSGTTGPLDLFGSARIGQDDRSLLLFVRSTLLHTSQQTFATRPLQGAFAMVSTGQEGVDVFYENRPVGRTGPQGQLLVTGLLAYEANRLSVNPALWPIEWTASQTSREVTPPRGGGVLVSFKINTLATSKQALIVPLSMAGSPYPAGTVAVLEPLPASSPQAAAVAPPESVVDSRGQLWLGDFNMLPDAPTAFAITQNHQRCFFVLPPRSLAAAAAAETASLKAERCEKTE